MHIAYLEILRSRDFWRELLILWQINRFRSMERPRSCTWRCLRSVSYLTIKKTRLICMTMAALPTGWVEDW